MAAFPTAHTLARLRIAGRVAAPVARLATGWSGAPLRRTGFAPAGRQTEFHGLIASPIPSDQPFLVALFFLPPRIVVLFSEIDWQRTHLQCMRAIASTLHDVMVDSTRAP